MNLRDYIKQNWTSGNRYKIVIPTVAVCLAVTLSGAFVATLVDIAQVKDTTQETLATIETTLEETTEYRSRMLDYEGLYKGGIDNSISINSAGEVIYGNGSNENTSETTSQNIILNNDSIPEVSQEVKESTNEDAYIIPDNAQVEVVGHMVDPQTAQANDEYKGLTEEEIAWWKWMEEKSNAALASGAGSRHKTPEEMENTPGWENYTPNGSKLGW